MLPLAPLLDGVDGVLVEGDLRVHPDLVPGLHPLHTQHLVLRTQPALSLNQSISFMVLFHTITYIIFEMLNFYFKRESVEDPTPTMQGPSSADPVSYF